MKKFKFNLESVLKYRKALERDQQWQLSVAGQALNKAREELSDARQTLESTYSKIETNTQIDVVAIQMQEHYRAHLAEQIEEKRKEVAQFQMKFNERRAELAKAAQAKEVIVTLKDQALATHRHESGLEQQNLIDELTARSVSERTKGSNG
jgi:flagellar FliJ protein